MKIQPVLSYKQLRKIDVNTTHSDMKLGTGAFSIVFRVSPYPKYDENSEIDNHSVVDYASLFKKNGNDMFDTSQQSTEDDAFFPIFTYNPILLYDHFNKDTKSYFYNTHACYIYRGFVHWLINDMSDVPLIHLTAKLPTIPNTTFNVILSRDGNEFGLDIGSGLASEYTSVYRDKSFFTSPNEIDLDIYDTGNITIGYAERVPTYSYNSYTYKNTLYGNLDYFKIFKDVAYKIDLQNNCLPENITQNSKYVFDGITYHNRDNKKCQVNQTYQSSDGVNYKISDVHTATLQINHMYDTKESDIIDDSVFYLNVQHEYNEEFTSKIFPILKIDVEKPIDSENVEFQQDKYVITGFHNDSTADFNVEPFNIALKDIESINNLISLQDIFKGQITNTIDTDNSESLYINNWLNFTNIINDLIKQYDSIGINVKNINIVPNKSFKYTIGLTINFDTIQRNDIKPQVSSVNPTYFCIVGSNFNDSNFKTDLEKQIFYSYTTFSRHHAIGISDTGMAIYYKNVLKYVQTDLSKYVVDGALTYEQAQGDVVVYASSQAQFYTLIDPNEMLINYDIGLSTLDHLVSSGAAPFNLVDTYSSINEQSISNLDYFTLETTDGTILLQMDLVNIDAASIYETIIENFTFDYLMNNICLIMVYQIDGTKYFLSTFDKLQLQPKIIGSSNISQTNEIIGDNVNITTELSNDMSDVIISFDQKRAISTNDNFILLKYYSSTQSLQQTPLSQSLELHPYQYVQNDIIPKSDLEKKFVVMNDTYVHVDPITIKSLINAPINNIKFRPNGICSDDDVSATILTPMKIKQNQDGTWYIK